MPNVRAGPEGDPQGGELLSKGRNRRPVRATGPQADDDARQHISLPSAMTAGDLTVSFVPSGGPEFATSITFGARGFSMLISRYPELVEFRAMLEAEPDRAWSGKHFLLVKDEEATHTLWLKSREVHVDLSARVRDALRDLLRQAWKSPDLQRWLLELQQEYGEQG